MASTTSRPLRRISDLQRSAFWIYGVTAMVMREPLGLVIRHISDAGLRNWQVRLELLRIAVILLLLSRLFLFSGLYFEQVFMQPDSAERYPRRSYPIDFLNGLSQFLVATAATTAIGLHVRIAGWFAPFTLLVYVFLLADWIWLAVAKARRFSSAPLIASWAASNAVISSVRASLFGRSVNGRAISPARSVPTAVTSCTYNAHGRGACGYSANNASAMPSGSYTVSGPLRANRV